MINIDMQQWYKEEVGEPFYLVQNWCKVTKEWRVEFVDCDEISFTDKDDAIEYCKHSGLNNGLFRVLECRVVFELTDVMPDKYKTKISVVEDSLVDKINKSLKQESIYDVPVEITNPLETTVYITDKFMEGQNLRRASL